MKRIFALLLLTTILFLSWQTKAQSPEKMSYQAVIRNSSNQLVTNTLVGMKISILKNTTTVYQETQTTLTNANGLVSIEIGTGAGFSTINWSNGPYFIKIETDPTGGTNYTITGSSQLLSVPYSLHAKTAETISGTITETDPIWSTAAINYYTKLNMQTNGSAELHFGNITNKPTGIAGYGITDAMSTSHVANGITAININNWNMAYSWGNHAGLYRPISYVPLWSEILSKPVFANVATSGSFTDLLNSPFSINSPSNNQLLKFNSLTGKWENWTPDYASAYTEVDPVWSVAEANYYTKINMQTSGSAQLHFANITNKPTSLAGYGITNGMSTSHDANSIVTSDISNWNTAFSWGNHSGLYRPITYVPDWSEILNKPLFAPITFSGNFDDLNNTPFSINTPLNNQILKFNSLNGKWENWTPDYASVYTEVDPVWSAESSNYYTRINMQTSGSAQLHFANITNKPTSLAGYGITDGMSTSHAANAITTTNINNWTTAFGWGNHAGLYRPISYVPAWIDISGNPFVISSPTNNQLLKFNISSGKFENWTPDYLSSFSEADPVWTASVANYYTKSNMQISGSSQLHFDNITNRPITLDGYGINDAMSTSHPANNITASNISNWSTAYSWGYHGSAGYLTSFSEVDPSFMASPAYGITTNNIANWTTAYSWGNHSGLYKPVSYAPIWTEITSNPFSINSPANNQLLKYNSVSGKWENWTPDYASAYTEVDPIWTAASSNYYTKTNLQTIGFAQVHFGNITNKPSTLADYGIVDFDFTGATINDFLQFNGTKWVRSAPSFALINHTHADATTTVSGFMSIADKLKLDNMQSFDGTETKINAGANVIITGTGSTANPYVINATASHYIGELYGGGIVVALWKEAGVEKGLIASLTDISTSASWSNITGVLVGAAAQSPVDGQTNTNAIINQSGHTSSAAKLCDDYAAGGFTDWYLPAVWELNCCYNSAFIVNSILGATDGFQFAAYWSSTEFTTTNVWTHSFVLGYPNYYSKSSTYKVRAVRKF